MNCLRQLGCCMLLACALASAAPPQLVVPHGHLGRAGSAGPSAVWRGEDGAAFVIETSGDIAAATGTVQRRAPDAAEPAWEASSLLAGMGHRSIYTRTAAGATIPFAWASLPPAVQALLDGGDGHGALRTDYLRGNSSPETARLFRKRKSLLGDIVNSVPLMVGAPPASEPGEGHAAFRAQFRERALTVYAGANDGMLHAFSAASGAELFAYIPAALLQDLALLSRPDYQARPYVDASPGHGDVRIGASWHSVLVSGMGMGARGVFALDITDPERFAAGKGALWEFSEADDPAIGHVRAPPLIARLGGNGEAIKGAPQGHFAVFSSGINNQAPDGALFLLRLDKPAAQAWKQGANYLSIATSGGNPALPNALSAPALVVLSDGRATRAYAGDLQGNLWRFDLASLTAQRLFTARDSAGVPQPIAHAPKIVYAPGGGYLLLFATGKLLEAGDVLPPSFTPQAVYAILDAPDAPGAVSRAQLAERTLSDAGTGYAIAGDNFSYTGPNAKRGWTFDFPNARSEGERAAGSPLSFASAIVIASVAPGARDPAAGAGRLYLLDALTGFSYKAVTGAEPDAATGKPTTIDTALPLLLIASRTSSSAPGASGSVQTTRSVTLAGTRSGAAPAPAVQFELRYPSGRLGWREVANWQELHQRAIKPRR